MLVIALQLPAPGESRLTEPVIVTPSGKPLHPLIHPFLFTLAGQMVVKIFPVFAPLTHRIEKTRIERERGGAVWSLTQNQITLFLADAA